MLINRSKHKFIVVSMILGLTIIYNEYLVYEINSSTWNFKKCTECVRVLLVADPQILGEYNENYIGASFAIWDSDRYLAKTFARALKHSEPHVIIFLGDIMDEGHIATTQQFVRYKNRFDNIFYTPDHIMKIYLPGDNDIGGEEDSVSSRIHDRFKFTYSQPDTIIHDNVIFFKVNRLINYMPNAPKDAFLNDYAEQNVTNVVLSHVPLLFNPGYFVKNVIKELSPQIIFTAHEHKAMHLIIDTTIDQFGKSRIFKTHDNSIYQLRFDMGDIHEIQIPSCSYRMGSIDNMGYGLAYIDTRDKSVDFTILWLPSRFPKLKGYLWIIAIILFSFVAILVCNCFASSSSPSSLYNNNSNYMMYNHLMII
ncbi:uncharacterized protein LOC122856030 [Aphidius gifuensis]|uniref:uncharacterized protein LOC122856030 n=1 Tax=Aphidius gifuensis TaxID=684658 RepID=UPI001CDB94BE|nr:uncharacterized protein LOC122856030 [Aphidius gifuensis]